MHSPLDIQHNPAKSLAVVQRIIADHANLPPADSFMLALLILVSHLDQARVNAIIDAVPPETRDRLIDELVLISGPLGATGPSSPLGQETSGIH